MGKPRRYETFGDVLRWRSDTPSHAPGAPNFQRSARYGGQTWTMFRNRKGWLLDMSPESPHPQDPGNPWPDGFPLAGRVTDAQAVAELRMFCPETVPTCTQQAPSVVGSLLRRGEVWPTGRFGTVTCRPGLHIHNGKPGVEVRQGEHPEGTLLARITPLLDVPVDPEEEKVRVLWNVEVGYRVDRDRGSDLYSLTSFAEGALVATWDQAFLLATGERGSR